MMPRFAASVLALALFVAGAGIARAAVPAPPASGQHSAAQMTMRRVLRPVVRDVLDCLVATRRTLRTMHKGETLSGPALTSYIAGPVRADTRAQMALCDRLYAADKARWRSARAPVRAVIAHAVRLEGLGGLLVQDIWDAVAAPAPALRAASPGLITSDGADMTREGQAFIAGLNALSGTHVALPLGRR